MRSSAAVLFSSRSVFRYPVRLIAASTALPMGTFAVSSRIVLTRRMNFRILSRARPCSLPFTQPSLSRVHSDGCSVSSAGANSVPADSSADAAPAAFSIVRGPIPRAGELMMRRRLTSSWGLMITFR